MFFVTGLISSVLISSNIEERTRLLITSCVQNVLVFIFPSYILAKIEKHYALKSMGLLTIPSWVNILGTILIMILAIPALNQIIFWNQNMSLPNCMHSIETIFREWEINNNKISEILLSGKTPISFISSLLVIGIITPIGEELFFRAGLQRIFMPTLPKWIAVWLTAFIFSSLHLQFFGFIPRLLLGAFFGYLYSWTHSIWTPIIAHAINNSIVVIVTYLVSLGYLSSDIDQFGITHSGIPWIAFGSFISVVLIFIFFRKDLFNGTKNF